jgi:hypothetical protein
MLFRVETNSPHINNHLLISLGWQLPSSLSQSRLESIWSRTTNKNFIAFVVMLQWSLNERIEEPSLWSKEGSNPSPGALIEGISDSFKADESEQQATSELMSQKTSSAITLRRRQQQLYFARPYRPALSTVDPTGASERMQLKAEEGLQELDRTIDSITAGMSRKAFNSRLKALARINFKNASTICDYILAEQTEQNIKPSTAESKVKLLIWLTRYLDHKPYEQMTKQDILSYLNSIRKPVSIDPLQRWVGSYNGRLRYLLKFFRWLHNKDEPDYRKRAPGFVR